MPTASSRSRTIPLVARFPALAAISRLAIGRYPTPVESLASLSPALWIKRDDRTADPVGGNKVRALEFLLGGVAKDDRVITVGSAGSTHALSLATYAPRTGAQVELGLWRQEMNPAAEVVAARLTALRKSSSLFGSPLGAYLWAFRERLRGAVWVAAGGSTPLGVLGHVNAGLELVEQIDAGLVPQPDYVLAPLGTGGTAAGLALAFAIAQRKIVVVGAQVVPRIVARKGHVLGLAKRTARMISSFTKTATPPPSADAIVIDRAPYGGAYGRETSEAREAAQLLARTSRNAIRLDGTYSAKAFSLALDLAARGPTVFWLTFDSRILDVP